MEIEQWPIERPTPYARNPRKIGDAAVTKVASSIKEYGWRQPIVVDKEGVVIVGHTRLLAARKLGETHVPVHIATDMTPQQIKAYRLADNRTNEENLWDNDLLSLEMSELHDEGFSLDLTGFNPDEIADLFGITLTEGNTDPDDVPEPPVNPITALGDVWLMGNHRLCCGDSTDADTVAKALNGVKPHLMVTDPPYGVDYDASWRLSAMPEKNTKNGSHGKVMNDSRADWSEAWALFPGEVAYVWHGGNMAHTVAQSLIACDFEIRAQIIWAKNQFVIGRGHYHPHHEPCWYAVRKGKTGHWVGDRKQSTIWQIDKPVKSETGHSTQKPVECMKRPIENNSSPGQAVYEPFSGSGTTIMAGEMTGRSVHAIELNPAYVDVTIKRWQDFTGKEATLEGDGRTFNEMCEVRYAGGDWAKNASGSYDDAVAAAHVKTRSKTAAE